MVLDLGVGQGRALDGAPHHRLGAAIELAAGGELMELGDDGGFAAVVHGGVAVPPIAQHAQALELDLLGLDPAGGVFAAALAELGGRHLVLAAALGAEFFLDLPLDRQAVAVPAGHVVDVVAQGEARADHEVLQRLVQGMADVDRAIGVGRAVVQHEQRGAGRLARCTHRAVQALVGQRRPALQDLGLLLGQAATHRERGVGEEDGLAVVASGRGVVGHGKAIQRRGSEEGCGSDPGTRTGKRPAASRRAANSRGFPNERHGRGIAEVGEGGKPPLTNQACHPGQGPQGRRSGTAGNAGPHASVPDLRAARSSGMTIIFAPTAAPRRSSPTAPRRCQTAPRPSRAETSAGSGSGRRPG